MKAVPQLEKDKIIEELLKGKSIREVASIFGVSKSLVYEIRVSSNISASSNTGGQKNKLSPQTQCYCT
jgi:transposase